MWFLIFEIREREVASRFFFLFFFNFSVLLLLLLLKVLSFVSKVEMSQ